MIPSIQSIPRWPSIAHLFFEVTPTYKAIRAQPMHFEYDWNESLAAAVADINQARALKRQRSYIIPREIDRVIGFVDEKDSFSIRFGNLKEGRGINGERGDFCLIGGAFRRRKLSMFYRSLELIGGLHYDQAIVAHLIEHLGLRVRTIEIFAAEAHCFALKRNSNEALHAKLRSIYGPYVKK